MPTEVKKYVVKYLTHFSNHGLGMELSARHRRHFSGFYVKVGKCLFSFFQLPFQSWLDLGGTAFPPRNSVENSTCTATALHIFKPFK